MATKKTSKKTRSACPRSRSNAQTSVRAKTKTRTTSRSNAQTSVRTKSRSVSSPKVTVSPSITVRNNPTIKVTVRNVVSHPTRKATKKKRRPTSPRASASLPAAVSEPTFFDEISIDSGYGFDSNALSPDYDASDMIFDDPPARTKKQSNLSYNLNNTGRELRAGARKAGSATRSGLRKAGSATKTGAKRLGSVAKTGYQKYRIKKDSKRRQKVEEDGNVVYYPEVEVIQPDTVEYIEPRDALPTGKRAQLPSARAMIGPPKE